MRGWILILRCLHFDVGALMVALFSCRFIRLFRYECVTSQKTNYYE